MEILRTQPGIPGCLEEELNAVALSLAGSSRRAQIFGERHGWSGSGPVTLAVLSDSYGISRERARQLCKAVEDAVEKWREKFPTPHLDRCIDLISAMTPGRADRIEAALVEAGLTNRRFLLEGLLDAAAALGKDTSVTLVCHGDRSYCVPRSADGLVKRLVAISKKCCDRWGLSTVSDVAGSVEEEAGTKVPVAFAQDVVTSLAGYELLDDAVGWFWLSATGRGNPLLNLVEKAVAVAGRVRLPDLRRAINRSMHMRAFAPPTRVLRAICQRMKFISVEEEWVVDSGLPPWDQLLPVNEALVVLALKELGPLAERGAILSRCNDYGMSEATATIYLSYSPAVARYARSVYGPVGLEFEPGAAEALVPQSTVRRVLVDYGWRDGKVWLALKLSAGLVSNGCFTVPSAMKRFLGGEYPLRAADQSPMGTLVVRDNQGWGLLPFLRRRGGEPGDVLLLAFDPGTQTSNVRLGDDSLLDEWQPDE